MKKITLFILSALLVFSSVSCSNPDIDETANNAVNKESASETQLETAAETIDPAELDELPADLTFDGAEFNILACDGGDSRSLVEDGEGYTGTALNDAMYDMELVVEDKLDVSIVEIYDGEWQSAGKIARLVQAGDSTYTAVTARDRRALMIAQQNCFMPMNNLEHIDLDKIYWGSTISETLSIKNKLYFAVSSFNLKSFINTGCIGFNKVVADSVGVEIPFEDVFNGTWTLDKFLSYGDIAARDVDGDGKDFDDAFTYGCMIQNIPLQLMISSGEHIIEKDSEDMPVITVDTNEKIVSILERVREVFVTSNAAFGYDSNSWYSYVDSFNAGNMMTAVIRFAELETLREMEDDFSIIPLPKYDETQKEYISHTYDSMFTMVPVNVKDTAMAGAVLESLSCEGYHKVIPAYIETTLQEKYSRDPETSAIIKIIYDTRAIDFGEAFMYDVYGNGPFGDMIIRNELNFASHFAKGKKLANILLNDILELTEE